MITILAWIALGLLIFGIFASVVPGVPGGLLSGIGVIIHWVGTGEPSGIVLWGLVLLSGIALLTDWFGGIIAARLGGVSVRLSLLAGVVGIVGLLVAGPIGLLIGLTGSVFLFELYRGESFERSLRTAAITTIAVFASVVVQVLFTTAIFLVILLTAGLPL